MFDILFDQEIQQAFFNQMDETEEKNNNEEGIVIPFRNDQEQLVRDIASLSDQQLVLLTYFVEAIKANKEE